MKYQAALQLEPQYLHTNGYIRHTKHQQINIIYAKYNANLFILKHNLMCIAIHLKLE